MQYFYSFSPGLKDESKGKGNDDAVRSKPGADSSIRSESAVDVGTFIKDIAYRLNGIETSVVQRLDRIERDGVQMNDIMHRLERDDQRIDDLARRLEDIELWKSDLNSREGLSPTPVGTEKKAFKAKASSTGSSPTRRYANYNAPRAGATSSNPPATNGAAAVNPPDETPPNAPNDGDGTDIPHYSRISRFPVAGSSKRFWVVYVGIKPGIYTDWGKVQSLVNHISGASQKAFGDYKAAFRSYTGAVRAGIVYEVNVFGRRQYTDIDLQGFISGDGVNE